MSFELFASDWVDVDDIELSQKNDWLSLSQRSDKVIVASVEAAGNSGDTSIPADETHAPTKRRRTQSRRSQNEIQKETTPTSKMQFEHEYDFLDDEVLNSISTNPDM